MFGSVPWICVAVLGLACIAAPCRAMLVAAPDADKTIQVIESLANQRTYLPQTPEATENEKHTAAEPLSRALTEARTAPAQSLSDASHFTTSPSAPNWLGAAPLAGLVAGIAGVWVAVARLTRRSMAQRELERTAMLSAIPAFRVRFRKTPVPAPAPGSRPAAIRAKKLTFDEFSALRSRITPIPRRSSRGGSRQPRPKSVTGPRHRASSGAATSPASASPALSVSGTPRRKSSAGRGSRHG